MQEGKLTSTKQVKIDKANTTILVILSVCSFVFVFSLLASKTLISQYSYQSRVTKAQQATVDRLNTDKQAAVSLVASYNKFNAEQTNIIGGSAVTSTSNQDGTNTKIILDALPIIYDYPSLIASLPNLINTIPGLSVTSVSGGNGPTASTSTTGGAATTEVTSTSTPTSIPVNFSFSGSLATDNQALDNIENSIRPIQVTSVDLSGTDSDASMTVTGLTYYLPSVGFSTNSETIK